MSTAFSFAGIARSLSLAALVVSAACPDAAWAAVGEAVFVRGDVRVILPDGTERALAVGQPVDAGQSLVAGPDGFAHLRFPDGGFVGVRPGSRFVLEAYTIDPAAPGGVRVRYRLDNGTVRAITGQTIEQNKHRFRLNTPVAAVGVRGTDYVVQATEGLTRASVNSGAIVMAPLGAGCEAASFGACETSGSRMLKAGSMGTYLEYRAGTQAPELRKAAPPNLVPVLPEEPASASVKRGEGLAGAVDAAATATADRIGTLVSKLPPPPPAEVVWGRWSWVATGTPTVLDQVAKGYQAVLANQLFGLLTRDLSGDLPAQGVAGFTLSGSEAWVREGAGLSEARVRDASLTIDFGARQFDTRLTVSTAAGDTALSAAGKVDWQGILSADASRSTMQVVGLLGGPKARDAGYLFERAISPAATVFGATSWRR